MARRSYQRKNSDAALWESYEQSGKEEIYVFASAIQDRIERERTLKGVLEFASKSTKLTSANSVVATWCEKHSDALENMGVHEVMRAIKIKPTTIQATVLAYFLVAVGPQVAYSWNRADRQKLFASYPMIDCYHQMERLGCDTQRGSYAHNVLEAASLVEAKLLPSG